jgi:thiamine biosynthesis lipoprotein
VRAAQITAGDVDPTVGEALIALGYDRDFASMRRARNVAIAAVASGDARSSVRVGLVPGWQTIELDREAGTIRLARGVKLDLGATAKALAADHAAEAARAAAGGGVLVSLGGDISICGPGPEDGWRVRVTDDHRSGVDAPGQWITLRSGGLATSSTTVRGWRVGEERRHHLVDPATGRSVSAVWRTASVAASSCLDANIASTAAIIRGPGAVDWLQQQRLPSRLVDAAGAVRHLVGWPSDGENLPLAEGQLG